MGSSDLKAVQVQLEPEAYDKIRAIASKNKRGAGPEIAFRIEKQLKREKVPA